MNKPQNINHNNKLALFEQKAIRRVWKDNKWYFSVVDIVEALTDSNDPKQYIKKMRQRDEMLDAKWGTICTPLEMIAKDGKKRKGMASDTEGVLRIVQSIPSKKAEPFKRWLARVGAERIEEINNPELAADRMRRLYEMKGYPKEWINQRELGVTARHRVTKEWRDRGANEGHDFAILTNEIYKGGFGLDAKEYKDFKNLAPEQNLRDSMTEIELALTNLGETTAAELHRQNNSQGMTDLKRDTKKAGEVTKDAREAVEARLGHPVVSKKNYLDLSRPEQIEKPDERDLLDE